MVSIWYIGDIMETSFTVRLKGEPALIINKLIEMGYTTSKNEAIRTALIFYAMRLGLITPEKLYKKSKAVVKASKFKYSDNDIKKQIEEL